MERSFDEALADRGERLGAPAGLFFPRKIGRFSRKFVGFQGEKGDMIGKYWKYAAVFLVH